MNKLMMASATITAALVAVAPVAHAATFNDIATYDAQTQKEINALADLGIINGTSPTTFSPAKDIKRSQVVKILGRFLVTQGYATIPNDATTKQRYSDLPLTSKDQELVKYAAVVKDYGIFNGSNGALIPSGDMTRQNMVLVLSRLVDAVEQRDNTLIAMSAGKTANVKDIAKAKAETQEIIKAFNALGLSKGTEFNPTGKVKRSHFASFMHRIITLLDEEEAPTTAGTYMPKDLGLSSISKIATSTVLINPKIVNGNLQVAQTTTMLPDDYFEIVDVVGKTHFGYERTTPAYFFAKDNGQVYLDQFEGADIEVPVASFKLDALTSFSYTTANGKKDDYAVINLNETLALNDAIGVNNIVTLTLNGTYGGKAVTRTVKYYFNGLGEVIFDTPRHNLSLNYHYELVDTGDVIVDGAIQTNKKLYYFPVSETAGWDQVAFSEEWTIGDLQKLTGTNGTKEAIDFNKHNAVLIIDENLTNYGVKSIYFMDKFFTSYTTNVALPYAIDIMSIEVMGSVVAQATNNKQLKLTIVGADAADALILITARNGKEYVFGVEQNGTTFTLEDLSDLDWEM